MTLTEILERRAQENAQDTAYIIKGDQKVTFAQFNEQCEVLAAALSGLGIKAGDRFAICLRNSLEFTSTWFALAKLGAIAVHVNFMISEEEMTYILKDSGSKAMVTQREFLNKARQSAASAGTEWLVVTDAEPNENKEINFQELLSRGSGKKYPKSPVKENTTAAILYTSGTTGKPKGAMLSHGNLFSNVRDVSIHFGLKPKNEVILCILPLFHVFALTDIMLLGIYNGYPVVIVESITPPKPWLKLMAKWKVSLFAAVPPIYHVLSKEAKGIKGLVLKYLFFRSVRICVSGAAPLPLEVLKTFEKKFGIPVLEGYGLTETSPAVTMNTLAKRKQGTVGTVLPNMEVKIIGDDGKELGLGEEGEICVKGPNVMLGYFNLPEDTKAAFASDGYFKTGDVGRFDNEGYLTICDRKKDMIIVKGLKVFPAQIEEIILRHPKVQEAAVVGIPLNNGDEIIKAFVVPRKDEQIEKNEIQEIVQTSLPAYKRPREIEFRSELPKNALQKILKRELRREAIEKSKTNRAVTVAV
ncbi:MAG: long-chain fatty acid--CoA ligase [Elusimicrobia bacterium]|nr:long-chain fatty acid--CoA ligase [Elusimicrobiota bacterium]